MNMEKEKLFTILPSQELYAAVRAGFVSQKTSLNRWCKEHGIHRQNARKVLLGEWKGTTAKALLIKLVAASRGQNE